MRDPNYQKIQLFLSLEHADVDNGDCLKHHKPTYSMHI